MSIGQQLHPYEKAWTCDDDKAGANRRKPRMYAAPNFGLDTSPYPLDFCLWLHRNFDALVAAIREQRLQTFDTW